MTAGESALYDKFMSLCLQGRCADALEVARRINLATLSPNLRKRVDLFIQRFSSSYRLKNHRDPIRNLISFYEVYWHEALLERGDHRKLNQKLVSHICRWLHDVRGVRIKSRAADTVETRLKQEIEAMGYFCIIGTVGHLRELEIWRKQRTVVKSVTLPETKERVRVFLMSDFLTKGWMAYASMGRFYPGGWAKQEGLYCNTHAYKLESEKFLVSYLVHEAQHFADYKKFPKLGQADLEYRAKLAEFALSRKTGKEMYRVFASRADYNKKSPHAFSYHCVVRDLAKEITGDENFMGLARQPHLLKPKRLNQAARTLMARHSLALRARGGKRVRSLIK